MARMHSLPRSGACVCSLVPPLVPQVLNDASGRYSTDLVVAGSKHLRTATNPTGRSETQRVGLPVVRAKKLEEFVTQAAGPNQLVTVLCVRGDDRKCRKAEAVAEVVNGQLHRGTLKAADAPSGSGPYDPETAPLRIVKVDTTEVLPSIRITPACTVYLPDVPPVSPLPRSLSTLPDSCIYVLSLHSNLSHAPLSRVEKWRRSTKSIRCPSRSCFTEER